MEHPVFRRALNGTLILKATAEASTLAPRQAAGQALYRAKKPEEVDAEAWAHVSRPRVAPPPTPPSPLGSAFAAFVSGRRSLSAVEMQAKIKKLVVPKPAFPASLGSALPSKPSQEPSDEELIRTVVDMEESSDVQAPLSLHPPPATSSSAPQKGAGVSAVLGEFMDELLEATQEQHHPLRPPAVVQPAESPAPSSLPPPAATAAPGAAPGQEELPGPAFLPPPPRELLPMSWRAALTVEQQQWIGRVLFTRDQWGRPSLITDLNLWWNPPQSRPIYHQPPASPDPFFAYLASAADMPPAFMHRVHDEGWAVQDHPEGRCKKKVGGWSQGIIRQLAPTYSCQFPAVLTYKLSCDHRVVTQLKSRTLGNSATQLCNTLREQHSDAWMRRAIQYLGVCKQFLALCSVRGQFPPPPQMPTLPSPIWLLTVYSYGVLTRLDEYKAMITSTFGSILKMDSTKKVTKKLAGTAFDTAAWVTNVGMLTKQVNT
ncbi:Ubiquitin carboxyl-terminal hydrolase 16 [Dissostichus eleginoides]|uniref:Ubiquitin carboxyl-terminal hydrolase 16 n=1 Tax=Dissostichus eleginoides TaxID=100907 RepID=A0AAD9C4X3_DISEL|nr:Ubiquitin carboxyl-terminal hydrolase 16 [Dissostichus eleginoides]